MREKYPFYGCEGNRIHPFDDQVFLTIYTSIQSKAFYALYAGINYGVNEFVRSDDFTVATTAVVAIGIGIFVKSASRRDHQKFLSREDFAVGLDLLVSSIIVLVTRSSDPERTISPWYFVAFFLAFWITSTWVRRCGWENDNRLKLGNGVLIPDVVGGLALIIIVYKT